MRGSAKANTNANRYSWGFPLLPLYSCLPTSARGRNNLAVKASKASRTVDDGPRPELTPSHSSCVPLTAEIPLGTEGWHHEDAARGGCPQPPLFLQSPSSLGRFWDRTRSQQESRQPPREGAFAGIFIPAGLFWFSRCFKAQTIPLAVFACMECPFSWDGGELGRNPSFPRRVVTLSLCHVLYFGDMKRNSAPSLAGWQEDVVNRRMFPSFWPHQKGEVPLTGVTGECCNWSW